MSTQAHRETYLYHSLLLESLLLGFAWTPCDFSELLPGEVGAANIHTQTGKLKLEGADYQIKQELKAWGFLPASSIGARP